MPKKQIKLFKFPDSFINLPNSLTEYNFPEPESIHEQIITIPNFFSKSLCTELIKSFEHQLDLQTTPLIKSKDYAARYNDRANTLDLNAAHILWLYLQKILSHNPYNDPDLQLISNQFKSAMGLNPNLRIYRYVKGHHFGAHYDDSVICDIPPLGKQKGETKWTLLIYLTGGDEFIGGDTIFYEGKKTINVHPIKGMALLHKHDIIFKRIQEGLQDFNYHYERYESLTNTEDDSDNQREKEKLANDLKKEIKKLQKYREQIKHWLSNDAVNTLGPVGTSYSTKLTENKSSIEVAMETYKFVEKQTKLKTFSNQSIMMTFIDSLNGDDDDDESDEDESSDEENENEYEDLSQETVDSIIFFKDAISQLRDQTDKYVHEYEKLATKKLRKNNLSTIEAKKEKISSTIANNKFHKKKLRKLIKTLKNGMITEFNLIFALKGDLEQYLSTNGDYDFTKDTDLYDDIFNQIVAEDEDYSELYDDNTAPTEVSNGDLNGVSNGKQNSQSPKPIKSHQETNSKQAVASAPHPTQAQTAQPTQHQPQPHSQAHPPSQIPSTQSQQQLPPQSAPVQQSPEIASPAIVRTLKPATTPSKPVGGLKWSAAAAAGIQEALEKEVPIEESKEEEEIIPFKPLELENIDLFKYKKIISNSPLSKTELNLFSDMNLVRVPPGIQDLVISFASKRNNDEFKVLVESDDFNQYTSPIYKPYLPKIVQPNYYSQFTNFSFKHPIQLSKFQSHWNKVRAFYGFESLTNEIKNLIASDENSNLISELTFVLFYGFYYGLTPAENLIAENCLFELGWKPYQIQLDNSEVSENKFAYWFRRIKLISERTEQTNFEFGDYQVFDLNFWEIFVKYGFKFNFDLSQSEPSKSLF
ncbi:NOT3 [Candida pseudojiufengensis]|uniref:NOT3 n=1 Tax=Candida pseudojiufengensis TaxID=497109 RepID=UPI002225A65A|nr:NOT3 [Candida pseudojiufengensis]KAI5960643.1 NOT3 [Candida pseudojiufengensis]